MTRQRAAQIITGVAAVGFLGTAWLHSTGYRSVVQLASDVPGDLGRLMPALWLVFSFDLVVVGLILAVIALSPYAAGRMILGIAGLCPLGAAALQLRFLGFIPPTALLLLVGVLSWAGALTYPWGEHRSVS